MKELARRSSPLRRTARRMAAGALCWLLSATVATQPVLAQGRGISLIRDAEIEHILRIYSTPIFQAAGLTPDAVSIALVKDDSLNAFVAGGPNMFFHTGLLTGSENVEQLLGVLAHETGHIAGGHVAQTREGLENAAVIQGIATLIGLAAAIGAGRGDAAAGVVAGGQELAARSFFSFKRTQESAADEAGLSYLEASGITSHGMLEFMTRLSKLEGLPQSRQVEFLRTHPLTKSRVDYIRSFVENRSRFSNTPVRADWVDLHERMKAKLNGFLHPALALRKYPASDTSIAGRYGRAIALYQRGDIKDALSLIDGLIGLEPENPYFHELRGQVLFENGRAAEAVPSYRKAVQAQSQSGLLRTALAHALLETGDDRLVGEAITNLQLAKQTEQRSAFLWRLLSSAYSRADMQPQLAYARAEEALARGDIRAARYHADRAEQLLPAGSPEWIRAQDIRVLVESNIPVGYRRN